MKLTFLGQLHSSGRLVRLVQSGSSKLLHSRTVRRQGIPESPFRLQAHDPERIIKKFARSRITHSPHHFGGGGSRQRIRVLNRRRGHFLDGGFMSPCIHQIQ